MNSVVKIAEARAMGLRVPPHSIDAEQAVLGGLMLRPDALDRVADRLREEDFYRKDHRLIWRAITELTLRGQPVDTVTMAEWFDASGLAGMIGGSAYLFELNNATASAANITAYADIVREKSVRRQLIDQAAVLVESAYGAEVPTEELLDGGIAGLMGMQRVEARNEYTLRQAMSLAYAEAQASKNRGGAIPGITTGITKLDRALGGWHRSDLIAIGARPAMGKTALLLNFAVAANVPLGIISAEMPAVQVGARVMSIQSHVPSELMRTGKFDVDHLRRLEWAVQELAGRTCLIYDRSAPTIAEVGRMARKWVREHGIQVLLVDYIQRIEASQASMRASKAERVGEVARGLKTLARELDIPVIALAQVGRQADGRQPRIGDFSDSSEIEKESDQVITLDRPSVYDANAEPSRAVLSIEKNRHGPTWEIEAAWLAETMRFADYVHAD